MEAACFIAAPRRTRSAADSINSIQQPDAKLVTTQNTLATYLVDVMQLMTYDENGSWGEPGPSAGLDWVEQSVKYAASMVAPAKISFGIPAYGYDWDLTDPSNNTQIVWTAIAPLVASTKAKVVCGCAIVVTSFQVHSGGWAQAYCVV